jgi:hypothetical protein
VPIEIIDVKAHHGFLTSPILGTDTEAWKESQEMVVKALEGTEWRSIDVVYRAPKLEQGLEEVPQW